MFIYKKVKNYMIDKHPNAVAKYACYVNSFDKMSFRDRFIGYIYFVKLFCTEGNNIKIRNGELEDNKRKKIERVIRKISQYDIISFDVFDTLIFRNVQRPEDIYKIVGEKCGISGFSQIRIEAEKICHKEKGSFYKIDDIYKVLNDYNEIDSSTMEIEIETEKINSIANPYMKAIFDKLVSMGKQVIIVSDMYLPSIIMDDILHRNGIEGYSEIFVSCECESSKNRGDLYKYITKQVGNNKSIVHIGDNYFSDYVNAKRHGFHSIYYRNISSIGEKYRCTNPIDLSLGTSVSNALINIEMHNGCSSLNKYQRYGYSYGGPIITGFCHWLNQNVDDKKIDKLLFLARDSEIIYKIYNGFYGVVESEYVYASRRAVLPLIFEKYPRFFVERVIKEWATLNEMTLKDVIYESHMTCLIDRLDEEKLNINDVLCLKNYSQLARLMYKYKSDIVSELSEVRKAALLYWKSVIGEAKTIGLVDVGWRGTIPVGLKVFLNQLCGLDVKLYCFQLSTTRDQWNCLEFDNNMMLSYCCSSDFNIKIQEVFRHDLVRIKIVEMLFASCKNSLVSYELDNNNKVGLCFDEHKSQSEDIIMDMHDGVLEFVKKYNKIEMDNMLNLCIPGEVSFAPMYCLKNSKRYIYRLFKDYILFYDHNKREYVYVNKYFKDNGY